MNTNDGSKVRSIQVNGLYIDDNYGDTTIRDDDSTVYISARDSLDNGFLCSYTVR